MTKSVTTIVANRYGMEPAPFEQTLRKTVVPDNCTREEFAAFLVVANEYNLNPITREIYAFPKKGGGIQPIVSIDGWMNLMNSHPQMDGLEFDDNIQDGNLVSISCRIWRKDRTHPIVVTEYMAECYRDTQPWKQWKRRMLRHKSAIQAARYAFGFAGIMDVDEAERAGIDVRPMTDVTPVENEAPAPGIIYKADVIDDVTGELVATVNVAPNSVAEAVEGYPDIPEALKRKPNEPFPDWSSAGNVRDEPVPENGKSTDIMPEDVAVVMDEVEDVLAREAARNAAAIEEGPPPPTKAMGSHEPDGVISDPDLFKDGVISVFKDFKVQSKLEKYWNVEVHPYANGKFGGDKLSEADWEEVVEAYHAQFKKLEGK